MKTVIAGIALFLSSTFVQAQPVLDFLKANLAEETRLGEGTWRGNGGTKDIWTSTLTVVEHEGIADHTSLKLTWQLAIHEGDAVTPMTSTLIFAIDSDFFIKIFDETGTTQIGQGYCDEQTCHIGTFKGEHGSMEETWTVVEGTPGMTIVGSTTFGGSDTVNVVYRGTFKEAK